MSAGPWAGVRVLELTGLTGAYATRMWAALAGLIGGGALDAQLATLNGRLAHHDALDALVEAWTSTRSPADAARQVQSVGVAACAVCDNDAVLADPQVRERQWFQLLPSSRFPDGDVLSGHPIRLGADPGRWWRAGPSMGEDTSEVLVGRAGMDPAEVDALIAAGAAFDSADREVRLRRPYIDRAAELGLTPPAQRVESS